MLTHWPLARSDSVNHGQTRCKHVTRLAVYFQGHLCKHLMYVRSMLEDLGDAHVVNDLPRPFVNVSKRHSSTTWGYVRIENIWNHRLEVHNCMYICTYIHLLFKDESEGNSGWWWVKSPPLSIISKLPFNLERPRTHARGVTSNWRISRRQCALHTIHALLGRRGQENHVCVSFKVGPRKPFRSKAANNSTFLEMFVYQKAVLFTQFDRLLKNCHIFRGNIKFPSSIHMIIW